MFPVFFSLQFATRSIFHAVFVSIIIPLVFSFQRLYFITKHSSSNLVWYKFTIRWITLRILQWLVDTFIFLFPYFNTELEEHEAKNRMGIALLTLV